MLELAYSFHIGNDKNKTKKAKQKNTPTNYNNNAIQNAMQLSKVNHHNLRQYDNNPEKIKTLYGSNDIVKDVKEIYKQEFEEARLEYNSKQTRDDRKIDDYLKKISDNSKNDLACEIIIELGDKKYWDTKDEKFKHKMSNVYKEQVKDLETLIPNFKVASAIIHFDETSPHMHIVGVPIKYKSKNGMSKQVGKSDVFTKTKLIELQDKMRTLCIASFNKEYGLNNVLKTKQKGRNKDINVKDMGNYIEMQEELSKNKERLEIANKKSLELDNNSNEVKDIVNNITNNTSLGYSSNRLYKKFDGIYTHNFTESEVKSAIDGYDEKNYKHYNVTTKSNYLYMIRETGGFMTGAYVDNSNPDKVGVNPYYDSNIGNESYLLELGYISNSTDVNTLKEEQDALAKAISDSIIKEINEKM